MQHQPYNFQKLTKQYKLPSCAFKGEHQKSHNLSLEFDFNQSTGASSVGTTVQAQSRLYYDEYLRMMYPEQYGVLMQPFISEERQNNTQFNRTCNMSTFENYFRTSAYNSLQSRQKDYQKYRFRSNTARGRKLAELLNYKLEQYTTDTQWKFLKKRSACYEISSGQQNSLFKNKGQICDERRFNNFDKMDFMVKNRAPNIEKLSSRKPLLNNMETPLIFYDNINKVYEKIVFNENGTKCYFDIGKSEPKDRFADKKQQETKLTEQYFPKKMQIEKEIQEEEKKANHINQVKMMLSTKKRFHTPKFSEYSSRAQTTPFVARNTKQNQNFYESYLLKEQQDAEKDKQFKEYQRSITPSDWKNTKRKFNIIRSEQPSPSKCF